MPYLLKMDPKGSVYTGEIEWDHWGTPQVRDVKEDEKPQRVTEKVPFMK